MGAFHVPRNSGNSGWDISETRVFRALHWKVSGNKWKFEKVVLFSRWKFSLEKARSIYELLQGITHSRLFKAISVPPSCLVTGA